MSLAVSAVFSACLSGESTSVSGFLAQGTLTGPPGVAGQVTLTQNPATYTNLTFATFTWTVSPGSATTTCSIDGAPAQPCTSPVNLVSLADGVHSLLITPSATGDAAVQPLTYTWVVKTSKPGNPTIASSSVISNGNSGILSGTCSADTSALLVTGADTASVPCTGGSWVYFTGTQTVDGTYSYSFQAQDLAGNLSVGSAGGTWTRDATPPLAVFNSVPSGATASTSATWFFSSSRDNTGGTGLVSADIALYTDAACTVGVAGQSFPNYTYFSPNCGGNPNCGLTSKTFSGLAQGTYYAKLTVYDLAGNAASTCRGGIIIDNTAPSITSFALSAGVGGPTGNSATNFLTAMVGATDNLSGVSQIQFTTAATPVPFPPAPCPGMNGTGWQPFTGSAQYVLPYSSGTYTLYAWVVDAACNVSASASAAINVTIGSPPSVSVIRPDGTVAYTTAGQTVHVDWAITSANALAASNPISVEYTTNDGATSTVVSSALSNGANGGCVIGTGGATGCYEFALPGALANSPFRVIVRAADVTGTKGVAISGPLNTTGLHLFAGHSSALLGGNALKTALKLDGSGELAMDSKGNLYAAGLCVIYKIDVTTQNIAPYVGNRSCATTGDGAPPSSGTTQINLGAGGSIAVDTLDQLYWTDTTGVRRVNKTTGNVETFVGGGAATAPATGTSRTTVNLTVSSLAFDSTNRLILAANYGNGGYAVVYRVDSNDTLEILAGNFTAGSVAASDGRSGGLGTQAGAGVKVAVQRSTTDTYFVLALDGNLYAFNPATYAMTYIYNLATSWRQMVYDPTRARLIAANLVNVLEIRTDIANTSNTLLVKDNGVPYGIARDSIGDLYYTTSKGQRIFRADPTDAETTLAGIQPDAGDGASALAAELRSPSQLIEASNGSIYLDDSANQRVRKIANTGTISAVGAYAAGPAPYNGSLAVPSLTSTYYSGYAAPTSVQDVSAAACKYFCGGVASTIYNVANGSAAATVKIPASAAGDPFVSAMAWDTTRGSLFIEGYDPVSTTTFVSEVDGTNNITRRIGVNGSSATPTVGALVTATALDALAAWSPESPDHRLQANNGVIYRKGADSKVYSFAIGGNVALETPAGVTVTSFLVDFTNSKFYWTVGNTLYMHVLGSGNSSTTVATFPYPLLLGAHSYNANSLLLTYGDQIFEYTNAGLIP